MSAASVAKGLVAVGALGLAGHAVAKFFISRKKAASPSQPCVAALVELEAQALIPQTVSNIVVGGLHISCAGLLLGSAFGALKSPQHVDSVAVLRRALLLAMPISGVMTIVTMVRDEKGTGVDFHKHDKLDTVGRFSRIAHSAFFVLLVAVEPLYNRTDLESNKFLIWLSVGAMVAEFITGKIAVRSKTLFYASALKKLNEDKQNTAR
eukprot:CAMPEP_0196753398 /NCGR_PEP_ID=MMETSP1091-20130531/90602_1 /TAXON_ID=302021 /ORGANISM="Rhodomonas sp., Strain CCMP768" /LENGTH=207 /DNA_ID=CAMNT_0042101505 /DNA_START=15 /DNA_END=638 /DNA_ORIENTATION=-